MKTEIDTVGLKQNTNLIELAGRYVELRKVSPKEYHGPCPWCGGDDRFRVTADHFACRPDGAGHCGRSGDAIEFIMQKQNVDFRAAVSILGGNMPTVAEKIKPISKPTESAYEWNESEQKRLALSSHRNLIAAATGAGWRGVEYLQGRCIDHATIKAFGIGYSLCSLPNTWDGEKFVYPKQLAISLPWYNHDGALVAVKYRFTESHTYTDKDGKQRTENKTSRGQASGNVFGWQALRGSDKCEVLIICEGEMNAPSLWQAGRGAIDVLSTGSESTTKRLPPVVVGIAHQYAHRVVWADNKEIADAAALQIGAASMCSPGGKDANDLLRADKLGALLTAMLGRLGVALPADSPTESVVSQPLPSMASAETPAPLPPIRWRTAKPSLPPELWMTGATSADAWAAYQVLKQSYFCTWGRDSRGFSVTCDPREFEVMIPNV